MRIALTSIVLLTAACGSRFEERRPPGPTSLRVTVLEGDIGSSDDPLPFTLDGLPFRLSVEALDERGERDASFDGFIRLGVVPGKLEFVSVPEGSMSGNLRLTRGQAEDVDVLVARAFGIAHFWAEDVGFVPAAPGSDAVCRNRRDDDGDGWWDYPTDPGCFYANDDSEQAGNYATGLSEMLQFANPTLADAQGRSTDSPLAGQAVSIELGGRSDPQVVVTALFSNGMAVSDLRYLDDYGHLYLYNYSTPERTRVCDRLVRLDGIMSEYFGYTELNFPSWEIVPWEGEPGDGTCSVPEPELLDTAALEDVLGTEAFEGGLVRVENVQVGEMTDCDLNHDGIVNGAGDSGCDQECECADRCERDAGCTEAGQFSQYGQWTVQLDAGQGAKLIVLSPATVPDFDPVEHSGETIEILTGILENIYFLDPPWILVPRCSADLILEGDPVPMDEACVTSRTEDPDDVL